MFTVIISEKKHIDSIKENALILDPILNEELIAFCEWDPYGETFEDIVPGLGGILEDKSSWRAIVIDCEDGLKQKNPFDLVWNVVEGRQVDTPKQRTEMLKDAYMEAAAKPLTRLVSFLCDDPLSHEGVKDEDSSYNEEIAEYYNAAREKSNVRKSIVGAWEKTILAPTEVICLALRNHCEPERVISTAWEEHVEYQYSNFCDRNLYYDKMRFLVFDILSKSNLQYGFEYLKFLYAVIIIAGNNIPMDSLRPQRVYKIDMKNDVNELRRIMVSYDEKLKNTEELIEEESQKIAFENRGELTDNEVRSYYCTNQNIPVSIAREFDQSSLYVSRDGIGLACDCPRNEVAWWHEAYKGVYNAITKFAKLHIKAVRKGVALMRGMNTSDMDHVKKMDKYQIEDVKEYVEDSEQNMVAVPMNKTADIEGLGKKLQDKRSEVQRRIDSRMSRWLTIGLGAFFVLVFLFGFLPLFISDLGNIATKTLAAVLIGVLAGVFIIVQLISLFYFRHKLKAKIGDFNGEIHTIVSDLYEVMNSRSRYLSYMCNIMRGTSVLNYYNEKTDKSTLAARVRQKHINDIRKIRQELRLDFGFYLSDRKNIDERLTEPYVYNYGHAVEYEYPLPLIKADERTVEFMQYGYFITVPFAFVKYMMATLEELYD